jgi:hypothetical protein
MCWLNHVEDDPRKELEKVYVEDIGHISFLEERSETGVLKNSEAEPG